MVKELRGAIIAGGRGERLRASTRDDIPKPLVMLGSEPMLARQARAMVAAGASSGGAVINSEKARIAEEMSLELPASMRLVIRDTANSMETMLALGEVLAPGWFLASTVDAVIPQTELARFLNESRRKIEECGDKSLAGVLGVTKWLGKGETPFKKLK